MQKTIKKSSAAKTILLAGFVAGTLDISVAFFVYSFVMKVVTPEQILHGIATTALGKTTMVNESWMPITGLLIHYIIAYCFAIGYFLAYPKIKFLRYNAIISGLLYGIVVWAIMNFIVVPLANGHFSTMNFNSFSRAIIILMICIGLPISIITAIHYKPDVEMN